MVLPETDTIQSTNKGHALIIIEIEPVYSLLAWTHGVFEPKYFKWKNA